MNNFTAGSARVLTLSARVALAVIPTGLAAVMQSRRRPHRKTTNLSFSRKLKKFTNELAFDAQRSRVSCLLPGSSICVLHI